MEKLVKNGNKEVYIKAKWATKRVVYDTERAAEKARFGDKLRWEDDRVEIFKIAMVKSYVSNEEKYLASKEHYQRLLNEELEWDKANLCVNKPSEGPVSNWQELFLNIS